MRRVLKVQMVCECDVSGRGAKLVSTRLLATVPASWPVSVCRASHLEGVAGTRHSEVGRSKRILSGLSQERKPTIWPRLRSFAAPCFRDRQRHPKTITPSSRVRRRPNFSTEDYGATRRIRLIHANNVCFRNAMQNRCVGVRSMCPES